MAASNHLGQAIRIPNFLATATLDYYADIFRALNDHIATPGRRDSKSLVVSPAGGMNISIGVGTAVVTGTDRGGLDASGISAQGSYVARADATITPVAIPGAGTFKCYLVVGDKTEASANSDDAYVVVLTSATAAPKSSLVLATVTVPTGSAAVTAAMISAGARSQHPALVDPNFGYVDKKTAMSNSDAPIAAKKFAMIGNGDAPLQGSNMRAVTTAGAWGLANATWTSPPWNNSGGDAYGAHLNDFLYSDSGSLYVSGGNDVRGLVPNAPGLWRVSASFSFGTQSAYKGRYFIQIITVGGRRIAAVESDAASTGDRPLSVSQPFVWWAAGNDLTDAVQIQLYQDSGKTIAIPAPYVSPLYAIQQGFIERIG